MGSHPCLPRPSVYGSLELTVRSRRSSSSTWILPSRGSVCPFSQPCFQWITLFARQDRYSLLFSFLSPSPPFVSTAGKRNRLPIFLFACSYLVAHPCISYLAHPLKKTELASPIVLFLSHGMDGGKKGPSFILRDGERQTPSGKPNRYLLQHRLQEAGSMQDDCFFERYLFHRR